MKEDEVAERDIKADVEQSIRKKFKKSIWRKFTKAINTYELVKPGDKIAEMCIRDIHSRFARQCKGLCHESTG